MVRGAVTASATELSDQDEFIDVIVVERLLKATQSFGMNMTNWPVTLEDCDDVINRSTSISGTRRSRRGCLKVSSHSKLLSGSISLGGVVGEPWPQCCHTFVLSSLLTRKIQGS